MFSYTLLTVGFSLNVAVSLTSNYHILSIKMEIVISIKSFHNLGRNQVLVISASFEFPLYFKDETSPE